jgi:LPPG:FO 2-phospho-L-lactate transferase
MKIVALAGGVGGAKLVDGLARILSPEDLTIIVNTGDDFEHFGLKICPDLDTICYTLAGIANSETGWGREKDTFHVLSELSTLQSPIWFRLGDKDLALHLERTRRIKQGNLLSQVTKHFLTNRGVKNTVFPMSDDPCPTIVVTESDGKLPFQEYFVKLHCDPKVVGFEFPSTADSEPCPGILKCIDEGDLIIFCPSNPFVSIDPILKVPGIKKALSSKKIIAISPIIGGKALKGPAAKMYSDLGIEPSAFAIVKHYTDLLSGIMIDKVDSSQKRQIEQCGIILNVADIVMKDQKDRIRLAQEAIAFGKRLIIG